jgi:N-acetylglucosaminyldiphosphoundecaprenol N-acetyl-beta-D-mannosaminyltransferase
LGAPKQEEFMYRITPKIDKGVLLGVGAALNYFSGAVKDIPKWAIKFHLIWLYRVFTEPKKQLPRCINTFTYYPLLFLKELKGKKNYS